MIHTFNYLTELSGMMFHLAGVVLKCNLAHRRAVAVLCKLFKIIFISSLQITCIAVSISSFSGRHPLTGRHPLSGIQLYPLTGILWAASSERYPLSGILWAVSSERYPLSGILWAGSSERYPLSGILWAVSDLSGASLCRKWLQVLIVLLWLYS